MSEASPVWDSVAMPREWGYPFGGPFKGFYSIWVIKGGIPLFWERPALHLKEAQQPKDVFRVATVDPLPADGCRSEVEGS